MPKWIPYDEYVKIYSQVPRITVEILHKTEQGILFVKRAIEPGIGNWHLPGGAILFNETIEEALYRIAKREIGLTVLSVDFLGINQWVNTNSVLGHDVSLVYVCQLSSDQIILDEGGSEWNYFHQLPSPTFPEYQKFFSEIAPNLIEV